ncbi:MAG: TraB/GumN family protein [Anaerolineae bacterium]|nr:TraB/GumN family protein [Phycisphaerae bacterium]
MDGVLRKFLRLFVCVLLLTASTVHAQTNRGLFWKVEKDGRTSYLFGTVHVWKREWLPLNPAIEKAFSDSKTLAVELDPSKMDVASAAQRMMLAGGDTLEARLGKPLFEQTRAETAKLGVPEAAIATMKPWGVMLVLAATKLQQLGFTPDAGLDNYLIQKAGAGGKRIVELESGDQQLAMLDGLSARLQNAMLSDFLANMERTPQVIGDIVVAWKRGDAAGAYALNQKGFNDSEAKREFDDKFLYQRDVAMTRGIEELLRQPGPHFIAVGSLHLVGPKSIVEQLKAKGYRVEQI